MSRNTRSIVIALCTLTTVVISQIASAAGIFTSGNFNKAEDLGWDIGNTSQNVFVQAEELGTTGGTTTVGAVTFTNAGNAGQGSYNFFNANFGGAYATQMNALINPLALCLRSNASPAAFSGTLNNLIGGVTYRLRLMSYDGDNSVTNSSARGDWTLTVGSDSTTVNAWSSLGLSNGSWTNAKGSYFQDVFVPSVSGNVSWSLGVNDIGKYTLVTALTVEALPEPSTFAIFGLGALMMIRRTRKM